MRVKFTLCGVRFFAALRMTILCKLVGAGFHARPSILKNISTNGEGKVSPVARSVLLNTLYSKVSTGDPPPRSTENQIHAVRCEILRCAQNDNFMQTRRGGFPCPPEHTKKHIDQRRGQGLACRLGRCFCILPYAEVSTPETRPPALPKIKFTLCRVRFFAALRMTSLWKSVGACIARPSIVGFCKKPTVLRNLVRAIHASPAENFM